MTHDIQPSLDLHEQLTHARVEYEKKRRGTLAAFPAYVFAYEWIKAFGKTHGTLSSTSLYREHVYIRLYLTPSQTPKDAADLIEGLTERLPGTKVVQKKTGEGQTVGFPREVSNSPGPTATIWINLHGQSKNCERVQVGVEPVYEWKCKDAEEDADDDDA